MEIRKEIRRLKRGKAAGEDGIRNEAWLAGGEKIEKKLVKIIKGCGRGKDSLKDGGQE